MAFSCVSTSHKARLAHHSHRPSLGRKERRRASQVGLNTKTLNPNHETDTTFKFRVTHPPSFKPELSPQGCDVRMRFWGLRCSPERIVRLTSQAARRSDLFSYTPKHQESLRAESPKTQKPWAKSLSPKTQYWALRLAPCRGRCRPRLGRYHSSKN